MKIPHWVKNCVMKLNEPTAWYSVRKGYNSKFKWPAAAPTELDKNEIRQYADDHKEGPGLWKFDNYFEIYDRHFRRFREKDVHVLEIGVYSGGSLDMWRSYFGPKAKIYGVDREPACTMYEGNNVKIFIGNQRDRNFWKRFREQVPNLDVVIDDAGHHTKDQIASFEELFPHLRPGGVYLCEDVTWAYNRFTSYAHGITHKLNDFRRVTQSFDDPERRIVAECTPFQSAVSSVHFYPYVVVFERTKSAVKEFVAPKRGTQWQPFIR
jgi:SAM-dependent methyltransferase